MTSKVWLAGLAGLAVPLALAAQIPDSMPLPAVESTDKLRLSGYVTSSYAYATQATGRMVVGRLYDRFHNQIEADAARLTIERSVSTDKFEAGFRVDALFGQNATPIRSAGLSLGDQGDLPQAFVTLNVPTGPGKYLQFKAGKLWTLLDVEVVDEVLNPNFSHGYQYIYLTNFTNTGIGVDAKFSSRIDAQLRVINGWDVVEDNNTRKSFMGRVGFTPSDRLGFAVLGYYGPEQTENVDNDRYGAEFVGTFKLAPAATLYAQLDYGGEQGLSSGGRDAKWLGIGAWGVLDLHPAVTLAIRADYMDDRDGARTSGVLGFGAAPRRKIGSGTVTLNMKSWRHALVRPEIRWEHSNLPDFGELNDRSSTQVTFGFALSYLF